MSEAPPSPQPRSRFTRSEQPRTIHQAASPTNPGKSGTPRGTISASNPRVITPISPRGSVSVNSPRRTGSVSPPPYNHREESTHSAASRDTTSTGSTRSRPTNRAFVIPEFSTHHKQAAPPGAIKDGGPQNRSGELPRATSPTMGDNRFITPLTERKANPHVSTLDYGGGPGGGEEEEFERRLMSQLDNSVNATIAMEVDQYVHRPHMHSSHNPHEERARDPTPPPVISQRRMTVDQTANAAAVAAAATDSKRSQGSPASGRAGPVPLVPGSPPGPAVVRGVGTPPVPVPSLPPERSDKELRSDPDSDSPKRRRGSLSPGPRLDVSGSNIPLPVAGGSVGPVPTLPPNLGGSDNSSTAEVAPAKVQQRREPPKSPKVPIPDPLSLSRRHFSERGTRATESRSIMPQVPDLPGQQRDDGQHTSEVSEPQPLRQTKEVKESRLSSLVSTPATGAYVARSSPDVNTPEPYLHDSSDSDPRLARNQEPQPARGGSGGGGGGRRGGPDGQIDLGATGANIPLPAPFTNSRTRTAANPPPVPLPPGEPRLDATGARIPLPAPYTHNNHHSAANPPPVPEAPHSPHPDPAPSARDIGHQLERSYARVAELSLQVKNLTTEKAEMVQLVKAQQDEIDRLQRELSAATTHSYPPLSASLEPGKRAVQDPSVAGTGLPVDPPRAPPSDIDAVPPQRVLTAHDANANGPAARRGSYVPSREEVMSSRAQIHVELEMNAMRQQMRRESRDDTERKDTSEWRRAADRLLDERDRRLSQVNEDQENLYEMERDPEYHPYQTQDVQVALENTPESHAALLGAARATESRQSGVSGTSSSSRIVQGYHQPTQREHSEYDRRERDNRVREEQAVWERHMGGYSSEPSAHPKRHPGAGGNAGGGGGLLAFYGRTESQQEFASRPRSRGSIAEPRRFKTPTHLPDPTKPRFQPKWHREEYDESRGGGEQERSEQRRGEPHARPWDSPHTHDHHSRPPQPRSNPDYSSRDVGYDPRGSGYGDHGYYGSGPSGDPHQHHSHHSHQDRTPYRGGY